jgi:hypothetical protein
MTADITMTADIAVEGISFSQVVMAGLVPAIPLRRHRRAT